MESGNGINSRQVASWILGGDSGEEVMLRVKQRSSCYHFLSKVLRARFSVNTDLQLLDVLTMTFRRQGLGMERSAGSCSMLLTHPSETFGDYVRYFMYVRRTLHHLLRNTIPVFTPSRRKCGEWHTRTRTDELLRRFIYYL
jgi:hypothetical protein